MQDFAHMYRSTRAAPQRDALYRRQMGDGRSAMSVDAYDKWLHERRSFLEDADTVMALVGDGHQRVEANCEGDSVPRTGSPPSKFRRINRDDGWFTSGDPQNGRRLSVSQMTEAECNQSVFLYFGKCLRELTTSRNHDHRRSMQAEGGWQGTIALKRVLCRIVDEFRANKAC